MVPPKMNIIDWKLSGCKELIVLSGTDIASISRDRIRALWDPWGNFSTLLRIVQKYLEGSRAQGNRNIRKQCSFLCHYLWTDISSLASRMIVGFIHHNHLQVNQEFLHLVLAGDSKNHERVISKEDYNAFIRKREFWEQAKFASCGPFLSMNIERALSGTDRFNPKAITNSSFDCKVDYDSIETKEPGEAYFYEYFQSDNDDANNEESGEGSSGDDKGDEGDEGDNVINDDQSDDGITNDNCDNENNESDSSCEILTTNLTKRIESKIDSKNIVGTKRERKKPLRHSDNPITSDNSGGGTSKRSKNVDNSKSVKSVAVRGKCIVNDSGDDNGDNGDKGDKVDKSDNIDKGDKGGNVDKGDKASTTDKLDIADKYRESMKKFVATTFHRRLKHFQIQMSLLFDEIDTLSDIYVALSDDSKTISDAESKLEVYHDVTHSAEHSLIEKLQKMKDSIKQVRGCLPEEQH